MLGCAICPPGYTIRPAKPAEVARLPKLEEATAAMFPEAIFPARFHACTVSLARLAAAQVRQNLWVSLDREKQLVGFALLEIPEGTALLAQIDVLQEHGRKGLGRAMLGQAADKAHALGHAWLYLTTFREIPWNEPFYAKLGFTEVAEAELPAIISRILREERAQIAHPRLAMRLSLPKRG